MAMGDCFGEQVFMAAFHQAGRSLPSNLLLLDRPAYTSWLLAIGRESILPHSSAWSIASVNDFHLQYWKANPNIFQETLLIPEPENKQMRTPEEFRRHLSGKTLKESMMAFWKHLGTKKKDKAQDYKFIFDWSSSSTANAAAIVNSNVAKIPSANQRDSLQDISDPKSDLTLRAPSFTGTGNSHTTGSKTALSHPSTLIVDTIRTRKRSAGTTNDDATTPSAKVAKSNPKVTKPHNNSQKKTKPEAPLNEV
jgi:hypothetical protein